MQIPNVTWYCRQLSPTPEVYAVEDFDLYPLPHNLHDIVEPQAAYGSTLGGCFGQGPGIQNALILLYNFNTI